MMEIAGASYIFVTLCEMVFVFAKNFAKFFVRVLV